MPAPSSRSWAPWEKEAARSCCYCGERVLNADHSGTRYDDNNGRAWAWHAKCAPSLRITPERGPEWFRP